MYWWKRRSIIYEPVVSEIKTISITSPNSTFPLYFIYADTIEVDKNNNIVFVSPSNFSFTFSSADFAQLENAAAGKYWISDSVLQNSFSQVFYTPEQTTVTRQTSTQFNFTNSCEVIGKSTYSDWEYVQSTSSSTYPQSGEQDGYEYVFLGAPFQNIINGAQIETGSYIGTGTYGSASSQKNSITFEQKHGLVIIMPNLMSGGSDIGLYLWGNNWMTGDVGNSNTTYQNNASISDTTFTWYSTYSASYQFNRNGITYKYVAI